MPIVVDEVVIAVDVGAAPTPPSGASASNSGREASTGDEHDIVALCVERVLEVLAEREER